ncbi:PREDICTED: ankyrin repeat domain-containing protein 63 [Gekko japonicus]|uniref:Ankyrin repeat domain-containing protein 63 n=1 Tax=Gekko japonicus TaxID=146911 RepID=A0ABM1JQZ0_GEKJA|nr:PREDICTED: ankyrin repeat domain-containing protein 63 [Gekko japonicus]
MLKPRDLGPGAATRTFLEAMRAGRLHLGRFVLDALDGSIVDCRAERGRTPLMFAVALQDPAWRLAFARMLLERGAAVNLRDDAGRSALSLACERGHLDATQLLVQFGADPDAVDARGWSPLMYAASAGRTAVVEWLLRAFRRLGQLCLERAEPLTMHPGLLERPILLLQLLPSEKACMGPTRWARPVRAGAASRRRLDPHPAGGAGPQHCSRRHFLGARGGWLTALRGGGRGDAAAAAAPGFGAEQAALRMTMLPRTLTVRGHGQGCEAERGSERRPREREGSPGSRRWLAQLRDGQL